MVLAPLKLTVYGNGIAVSNGITESGIFAKFKHFVTLSNFRDFAQRKRGTSLMSSSTHHNKLGHATLQVSYTCKTWMVLVGVHTPVVSRDYLG